LNVEVRERTGTGAARAVRRQGLVPGVLYGGPRGPVTIAVRSNEFRKALHTGKLLGHLVTLKHGSETQSVIAKAVDMHPVTDEPTHFDLYRVAANQTIKIGVAVHFAHQEASPGLKRGGTLNVVLHEVLVACHANQIPDQIVVDLTGLEIGDSIRVSDLKLPKGVEAAVDADATVATVAAASVMADADEAADAATAEEAAAESTAEAEAEKGGEE
jgi:large subunit ribosomal protein L25